MYKWIGRIYKMAIEAITFLWTFFEILKNIIVQNDCIINGSHIGHKIGTKISCNFQNDLNNQNSSLNINTCTSQIPKFT